MLRRRALAGLFCLVILAATAPSQAADRVVSIGGAVTEIVYALGAEERLVAVDSTSIYPPQATRLPNVGYMRALAAEPILALRPSLVLAGEGAGPPEVLAQLRSAGVPLVIVPSEPSIDGIGRKIEVVADSLGLAEQGRSLTQSVRADIDVVADAVAARGERPRVLFVLSVGSDAPLVAGRDTSAASIIALAGGRNAVDGFEGFKPASAEALAAIDADVVLVTTRTLQQLGGEDAVLALPGVSLTKAARDRRVVAIDGLLLLGFGPRTGEGVRLLAEALHPGIALPPPAQ